MAFILTWVGLGSNFNQPVRQVQTALSELRILPQIQLIQASSLYQTKPWGGVEQDDFINAVALLKTNLSAPNLLSTLQMIEQAHGRKRKVKWGVRSLDLDILLYGEEVWNTDILHIPHPYLHERGFVLAPMAEIKPDLYLPHVGKTVQELSSLYQDEVVKLQQ